MASVMAIGLVFMAAPGSAENGSLTENVALTGDVPWVHDWNVAGNGTAGTIFTQVVAVEYDDEESGSVLPNLVKVTALDSNSYFKISAKHGAWTLPDKYMAGQGKKGNRADTDFRIKVTNVAVGTTGAADAFTARGSFGSTYTALTTVDQIIAGGYSESQGYEAAACDIDGSVLFHYDYDIKGTYGITLTLTIANATQ